MSLPARFRIRHILGFTILSAGAGVVLFCLAMVIKAYMPCPFWDEWVVVKQIGQGNGPLSLHWLWSQQNEHRLAVPRLAVWLDLFGFGGRNISLFVEIFLVQLVHLAAVCWAVERHAEGPVALKRSLQGLFAFALFHPNQIENFTWAFQIGFVWPFLLATLALIAVAFFERWRRPTAAMTLAGLAPITAALGLAGGLLIGPVSVALAIAKRLPRRYIVGLGCAFVASAAAYLYGYHRSATDLAPSAALSHAKNLFVYVLTYFGASWTRILPHKERTIAFISLIFYAVLLVSRLRGASKTSDLEWLLLAECTLMLATALLTAFGRIQFGVGQAFASRYQTPAMIYWAGLAGLVLIRVDKVWPHRFAIVQAILLLIMLASIATFPKAWAATAGRALASKSACQSVMGPTFNQEEARELYENPEVVRDARAFLCRVWRVWSNKCR